MLHHIMNYKNDQRDAHFFLTVYSQFFLYPLYMFRKIESFIIRNLSYCTELCNTVLYETLDDEGLDPSKRVQWI